MASIYRRKKKYNVIYRIKEEDGVTRQRWEVFYTREEAERRKDEVEYLLRYGAERLNLVLTVKDLMEEFMKLYGTNRLSMSTYESKQGLIRHYIIPTIGRERLADLNPRRMELYYQSLSSVKWHHPRCGRSDSAYLSEHTIHEIWKLLRQAFRKAVEWGLIEKNPITHAAYHKPAKKEKAFWKAEEVFDALRLSDDELLSLAMHLAFSASLRIGEVLALTWDNVDISEESIAAQKASVYVCKELQRVNFEIMEKLYQRDVIMIFPMLVKGGSTRLILKTPKTQESVRRVYLPNGVAKLLRLRRMQVEEDRRQFGTYYQDYGLVFCNNIGRPIESSYIERQFSKVIRENGLKPVTFHSLRHTSITYKLKWTGGDMKAVQGDSGHASLKMIEDVYSHILDEDRVKTAQIMQRNFYEKHANDSDLVPVEIREEEIKSQTE